MANDPPPLHIYDEMVDKARRAGTAVPSGWSGQDPAMTWIVDLPRPGGRITYAGATDYALAPEAA